MEEENKKRMAWGAKVALLILWVLCAAGTVAFMWNYSHDAFGSVVAAASFVGVLFSAVKFGKKF